MQLLLSVLDKKIMLRYIVVSDNSSETHYMLSETQSTSSEDEDDYEPRMETLIRAQQLLINDLYEEMKVIRTHLGSLLSLLEKQYKA